MNFIDGVGLSAQWSPEFTFDWLPGEQQVQHQQQQQRYEPARQSREPEATHTPEPEDIGTPFSTWLPSAPADDQVNLRSNCADGTYISFSAFRSHSCGFAELEYQRLELAKLGHRQG